MQDILDLMISLSELVKSVEQALRSDLNRAKKIILEPEVFEEEVVFDDVKTNDFVPIFKYAFRDDCEHLQTVLNASSACDVLWFLNAMLNCKAPHSDEESDVIDYILGDAIQLYSKIPGYSKYFGKPYGENHYDFMNHWATDPGILGGAPSSETYPHPFARFVVLACQLLDSDYLRENYRAVVTEIVETIVSIGGDKAHRAKRMVLTEIMLKLELF